MKNFVLFLLLFSLNANSAIFTVNSVSDTIDIAPGNGVCLDSFGNCSLRAAILESNALSGADTIYLQRSTTYELSRLSGATDDVRGDLDINESLVLSIINPATPAQSVDELPVIDANAIGRVIEVNTSSEVTLFGVVIVGGDTSNELNKAGGGILVGTVTKFSLLNSIVLGNKAVQGAGIQTHAVENLISFSDISFNSLLDSNSISIKGAAINNEGGDTTIQYSSIHHNGVDFSTPVCFASIRNSSTTSDMLILNSTITLNGTSSNNNCMSGLRTNESSLFLVNTTVNNNSGWGIHTNDSIGDKELFVRNSIIADNGITDCLFSNSSGGNNFGDKGGGNNITSDTSCNMPNLSGNMENTDPQLDVAKAVFPGLIPTYIYYEPLPDSPAIDNGSPLAVNLGDPDACQQFDQNLRTRPIDSDGNGSAVCDIGAVENNYDLIYKSGFE